MDTKEKFIEEAKKGNLEYVKAHFSAIQNSVSKILYNPILVGAFVFSPSIKICAYLLEKEIDINEPYRENYESNMYEFSWTEITALMYAVQTNNVEKTKFLLVNGANVNTPITEVYGEYHDSPSEPLNKRYIESPLMCAVKNGNAELIRILLEAGAEETYPNSSLSIVNSITNPEILSVFSDFHSYNSINTTNELGETPLLQAVKKNQLERVKNLISHGADVNFVNRFSESILMVAVIEKNLEIIKLLIEAGANVNYRDKFGTDVLSMAKDSGKQEIIKLLKSAGAKE